MLKGRGREPRGAASPAPTHFNMRPPTVSQPRTPLPQRREFKPEPDYEVVEFPSDQYVNAKLQPPPPPPPRPPTGHPVQASCGLCGGGGARVRCAECGRRALCASCDDMYHRHPKRRHHQRQALSPSQLSEDRPPLPPKTALAPVPPPRRHKMSASPKPPMQDQRHATLGHAPLAGIRSQPSPAFNQPQQLPVHIQNKMAPTPSHIGSIPFLNPMPHQPGPVQPQMQSNTLGHGHLNAAWNRPRGSLQGFNMPQMVSGSEAWERHEAAAAPQQGWGRPLRRGASVLELGGAGACAGCAHCAPVGWRYGSCASLDHAWAGAGGSWPAPACCAPHPHAHLAPPAHPAHPHSHHHPPQTPQPYRRAESRTASRGASRAGSRAASPALSLRSRASRRAKHRTPSPPLPSSDADSESESEEEPPPARRAPRPSSASGAPALRSPPQEESAPAPLPPPPPPPSAAWHCEHCTYVNEAGVRVCAICCRTPTAPPQVAAAAAAVDRGVASDLDRLNIASDETPAPTRLRDSPRPDGRAAEKPKRTDSFKSNREKTSTGCGPSPPREQRGSGKPAPRLVTPTREQNGGGAPEPPHRHDMAVGPSPPRDDRDSHRTAAPEASLLRESNKTVRVSPYRETKEVPKIVTPQRHSVSVGPSPPPEVPRHSVSVGPSPPRHSVSVGPSPSREAPHSISVGPSPPRDYTNARETIKTAGNFQKKSAGTSPPDDVSAERQPSAPAKTNVSNTGTSPPPQSISTQTYEEASRWERGAAGAGGAGGAAPASSRRRRLRDDARRERSRSRHSLSSDTRESERSVRTAGGSWEWRERESSPPSAEWGRLARRASHLDLRRARPQRRSSFYGSEAASPEPRGARAASMEALAGGARRGLELARLLADAERLGYDAAEVQVALEASPEAPLEWLRTRWAGLAGAVRGAAARLAPHAPLSEREARAALARHRGAVWPAVTECVDALRTQTEPGRVSSAARVRGRVWGSPAGADDDAAAPRARAEYSSDEFDPPPPLPYDDEWGPPPAVALDGYEVEAPLRCGSPPRAAPPPTLLPLPRGAEEAAQTLLSLLARAGVPAADENALLRGLLAEAARAAQRNARDGPAGPPSFDLTQSENDFIDAYNALTRASPLPNISEPPNGAGIVPETALLNARTEHDYSRRDDEMRSGIEVNETQTGKEPHDQQKKQAMQKTINATIPKTNPPTKREPKKAKPKILNSSVIPNTLDLLINRSVDRTTIAIKSENISKNQRNEIKSQTNLDSPQSMQTEEKTSNLNDIVDNTQKLIQQMKNEINSDINSLDDGHAQTSQSEHDTSSNDEREESSYSETEEETDNLTSDEKEMSSEEDYEEEEPGENSGNGAIFPNRTSSEDNEQFEEALDNLDDQIEDVKNANIEILDSIARSLQEEHTISVEVNEPKADTLKKKEEINGLIKITSTKEDSNNNLFVAVNSFDEIYAELNTSINKIKENNQTDLFKSQPLQTNSVRKTPLVEPKLLLTKHAANELTLKIDSPTKLLVSENREPIFNAILETTEVSEESAEGKQTKSETTNIIITNNGPAKSDITQLVIADDEQAVYETTQLAIANDNQVKSEITQVEVTNYEQADSENKQIEINNDDQEDYEVTLVEIANDERANSKITQVEIANDERANSKITQVEIANDEQANLEITQVEIANDEQADLEITQVEIANDEQLIDGRSNSESSSPSNESEPSQNDEIIVGVFKSLETQTATEISKMKSAPTTNNTIEPTQIEHNNHSNSIEKLTENPANNNNTNKSVAVKSNIPKPIRTTQNIKAKVDKLTPKLIVSKVPIRRASVKQYPAPAPPKTHFGNVQIGHVKQLQSKIFNSAKPSQPPMPVTVDVKPSTSTATLTKKKPAPAPPGKQPQQKQPTPPQASPKEKRNNYFRETCRTEDEWTDSDSEDSQSQIVKAAEKREEEPPSPPSPPPPLTLRRVSGQFIDLASVQLPEGSPERQARMLLAGGAMETWEQARLAVELVARGAAPPAALLAALACADLPAALTYLHQECELCASRLPEHEMVSMLRCTHRCCRECARLYFTVQVTERSIADCVCPYCKLPELETLPEDEWLEYFAHLDILLKTLLETDVHELFQRKLRDRTLARDPNFRWCMECSSGFFVHPKQKKLRCPECRSVSCASCRKPWSPNHEGLSCEQYTAWLEDNDPERAVAAVQQHLRENGLECPRCRFKYSLSRGGCMHFTCTQCKYEFCYGCGKPFTMGARCGLSEYCAKLGLHAHHPRNCLFYLRDKEPHELQTLLQMNNVAYETQAAEGGGRCPIQLQRETPAGLVDGVCGSEAPTNHAGLCKPHYVEYLAGLARALDPIPIMDVSELVAELRRRALPLPERGPWDTDPVYAGMCAEIVREKIPLD